MDEKWYYKDDRKYIQINSIYLLERTMVMKKKLLFIFLILFSLCLSYSSFASMEVVRGDIKVYVNDSKIIFDTQPVFINSRTMVPIRGVFEALGAKVEWDNETKTVTISKDVVIKVQLDNKRALVDGRPIVMDVPAAGIDGRILVPVRFISEALNARVEWVNDTKTVFIYDDLELNEPGNIQNWGKFYSDGIWNYYITQDSSLVRENAATKKMEKVSDNVICDIHIIDDWIYCIGQDMGVNKITRININSKEKEIITDEYVDSIYIVNNWIYYSKANENSILYRVKIDGTENEKIIDDGNFSPKEWFVLDGWIYYQNIKNKTISRVRIDGSDLTKLSELSVLPESNTDSKFGSNTFSLELIDKDFIYLTLENPGYSGASYYNSGIYRIPVKGGIPKLILNEFPVSVNLDENCLYMTIKNGNYYKLVKCKKDGTDIFTINEYKQNDIPRNLYLHNSTLYYTLLRGIDTQEEFFFKVSTQGGSISTITFNYGKDYNEVKRILTSTKDAFDKLDSYSTLQLSSSGKKPGSIMTSESKTSKSQGLFYQKIKEEEDNYLEIWTDKMYLYSKYKDEAQWNISESPLKGKSALPVTVFDYIQPTQELCNNLTVKNEIEKYILRGSGAFPGLMDELKKSGVLAYNYSESFISSVSIEIVISRSNMYIDEFKLNINYYDTNSEAASVQPKVDRYQLINSLFNSVYLNRPPELFQSVNAKNRAINNIESGRKKFNESKFEEAIKYFDAAIEYYDKAFDAYYYKGMALYNLRRYEEAVSVYEQYYVLNPKDVDILTLQGMCYLKLGDLEKAEEMANTVLSVNENSVNANNLIAEVAFAREDYKTAYMYYNRAIALDPGLYEAHIQILNSLFNTGNYTKCINTTDEFLQRFPDDRNILFLKARCYISQGRSQDAIRVFKDILKYDPANDFVTMTYIAIEYENLQYYAEAVEYAQKASEVYADYSLLQYIIQKLNYDSKTTSGQKLADFLKNYYLYYHESDELKSAIDAFTKRGDNYSIDDVKNLIKAVKSPDDMTTSVITGQSFNNLINFSDNSFMETKTDGNVVSIKIKDFTYKSGIKYSEYIQSLENTEDKILILDLRDNSGGLTEEANIMLDAMLGECNASYLIDRDGYISVFKSGKSHVSFKKIGILVNDNTAGSAELLALGLKTYLNNVSIIGKETMGRGTGQIIYFDRINKYAIYLVNHYWNVKQENIHGKGIPVDIKIDGDESSYNEAINQFNKSS